MNYVGDSSPRVREKLKFLPFCHMIKLKFDKNFDIKECIQTWPCLFEIIYKMIFCFSKIDYQKQKIKYNSFSEAVEIFRVFVTNILNRI